MHAGSPFVAYRQASESVQPCQGPFDDPARAPQATAMSGAALGQQGRDVTRAEGVAMRLRIIAAVALHDPGSAHGWPRSARDRRQGVDEREQLRHVVAIRRREDRDERNPVRVGENMMFRPGLAAIGRVRSSFFPPRSARKDALSTTTHFRLTWPRRRNSVSKTRCSRFQTPARCHRASRRQQALPEPQPISFGNMFQGIPLRSTNRMPVKTARSGRGFRPACFRLRGRRFGSSGSIRAHNSSSIRVMRDRLVGHANVPSLFFEYKRHVS